MSRLALIDAGVEFEDVRYTREEWPKHKPSKIFMNNFYAFRFLRESDRSSTPVRNSYSLRKCQCFLCGLSFFAF